ncbi:MAG: gluconate 2-dehydrogenase subunit 3 family protein [Chloroflexi bacterium]|nr:gluconate 2-dehydrogenase subunit 3 family protein [Chloroflexota bacterium]
MSDSRTPVSDEAFLDAVLDVVIPPGGDGRMPGAGTLGIESIVAAAVAVDAMLGPLVRAGLSAVQEAAVARDPNGFTALTPAARLEVVEAAAESHPFLMLGLVRYLYPAYYAHPRVLAAIGEPPRAPFPEGYEIEPTDPLLLEGLQRRRRA